MNSPCIFIRTILQVLRTQLAEGDKNVEKFKLQVSNSHKEKERLLQDANLSSGAHNHALDSLKAQLEQTQAQLQQEREASAVLKVRACDTHVTPLTLTWNTM